MSVWEWITANKLWLIVGAVAVVVLIVAIVVTVAVHKRKKGLFKFRRYKIYEGPPNNRQQHPKLIIEETGRTFNSAFFSTTETNNNSIFPKDGK